jgi:ribosomal protein S18 acetylase RimI-like enzyme
MSQVIDSPAYSLRPIGETDMPMLREIYYASRAEEMKFFPLGEDQKQQFLALQFDAQHSHYQTYYPQARYGCVLQNGVVIGRLYVHRGVEEMRIIDINLLPAYCNRGLGTTILQHLLAEADEKHLSVSAHVEFSNPARRLYARLGFAEVEERGAYLFVVRPAILADQIQVLHRNSLVDRISETPI